jgi:hypothetical protein
MTSARPQICSGRNRQGVVHGPLPEPRGGVTLLQSQCPSRRLFPIYSSAANSAIASSEILKFADTF